MPASQEDKVAERAPPVHTCEATRPFLLFPLSIEVASAVTKILVEQIERWAAYKERCEKAQKPALGFQSWLKAGEPKE